MTIDPQLLRSEQHQEIGALIRGGVDELIRRWSLRAVQEQPHAARAHGQELRDSLPALLRLLAHGLADLSSPDACPHCGPATAHGEQRWQVGWSLSEVVRDYQILRLVLTSYLEERLRRPLLLREVQAIDLALDEAVGASVAAYVGHREREFREQAAALAEADRRKNEFLGVLAHELRNPLAPILNAVEVLRLLGGENERVAQARDIVARQARQMARLVDDLLDVTRVAQGKLELRRAPFELTAAVAQAVQQTAPLYEALGHRLSVQLPAEPLALEGDQARVVQVLVNLLNNAAKYTDRGGEVRLSAGQENGELVLRVRDNGIGIEAGMLGRVFDLFTQVERARPRAQGGLGIGLTLVRQLVELHGGRVGAHSAGPGQGSEFVVRLPAPVRPGPAPAAPAPAANARVAGRRVLVVEDNADARATLETLLRLVGHQVEAAETGPAGVERALAAKPEVALIDVGLPELDGYEVARQVRAVLGAGVLLVALTGHGREADRQRALAAGFDAHLVKPVELDQLQRVLAGADKELATDEHR